MSPITLLHCDHGFPIHGECWQCWQRQALDAMAKIASLTADLWLREWERREKAEAERDALRRSNAHFDVEILRITVEREALRADLNHMHESSIRLVEEFNRFLLAIKEHNHERTGS